ncbi:MAG: hypothetical protein LBE22_10435 [Azoarcus sp.]|jgi:hypothetical protein|nr:hypothetical protein [Azoarcus sp.]
MTNHPNRNWRRCWKVDLSAATATHSDGWVFHFERDEEDGAWDGSVIDCPPLEAETSPEFAQRALRIAREAGEIYTEALAERH